MSVQLGRPRELRLRGEVGVSHPVVGLDTVRWGGVVCSTPDLEPLELVQRVSNVEPDTGELLREKKS